MNDYSWVSNKKKKKRKKSTKKNVMAGAKKCVSSFLVQKRKYFYHNSSILSESYFTWIYSNVIVCYRKRQREDGERKAEEDPNRVKEVLHQALQ